MAKAIVGSPIYQLTPGEVAEREAFKNNIPQLDSSLSLFLQDASGPAAFGARDSLLGSLAWGGTMKAYQWTHPDEYTTPLNLTKPRDQFDPNTDHFTFGMENNPETIANELAKVPFDEWGYILGAASFQEYKDRLTFVQSALPQAQAAAAEVKGYGYGKALGLSGDLSLMVAAGVAAEPLALLGTEATAGKALATSLGSARTAGIAEAAADASQTLSRLNLGARWTALGVAEEAAYQGARYGLDPTYHPETGELIKSAALAGGISGVLGGVAFGRQFVRDTIEEQAVRAFRNRTTDLPGGYKITWGSAFTFESPAAADRMLFANGVGTLDEESWRVAADLWSDWQRTGKRLDLKIPGTREVNIFEVPVTRTAPKQARVGEVLGIRSAIKAAAQELSIAGMPLNEAVFQKIAKALVVTDASKLRAGAFNKAFWEELSKDLPEEVVARLQKPSERAFIGGIDRTVMDIATREDMVTAIHDAFRAGRHLDPTNPKSLIFEVLQQIRDRGGRINRQTVADVVDELRVISQKPPKRLAKNGREVLDFNARRAAVIDVINKRVTDTKGILLPDKLIRKMAPTEAASIGGPTATGVGTFAKDFKDVPKVQNWYERITFLGLNKYLNQAAYGMESDNGALREMLHGMFYARRVFAEGAQPQTIFERGSEAVSNALFQFSRGYRNGFTKFAMGDGATENPNIIDALMHSFGSGNRELRRDFNRRVAKQLRSGVYDDANASVNDVAKGLREAFNQWHELAHSVGLAGFNKSAVVNYFPRLWRFDRIRRLATTEAGKQDLYRLIERAIDQDGRRVVIDGVEQSFKGDIKQAAQVFGDRLIDISKNMENAPLTEQEQALFDAIAQLDGPLKARTGSRTPYGRARILLNEDVSVGTSVDHLNHGRMDMTLADLMNDDLPFVYRKYTTSMMGAINERRLINMFNDSLRARNVLAPVKKAGEPAEILQVDTVDEALKVAKRIGGEINPEHEKAFRTVLAALRYEPINRGRASIGEQALSYLAPFGYLTNGGTFGLAAMGEVARIIGTFGVRETLAQMPIIKEMVVNWKNLDRPAKNMASLCDSWFSPANDRLRREFMVLGDQYERNIAQKALTASSNLMADVSLLAPINSFSQQLTAAATLQHLWEVSKGITRKRLDIATIRQLGLEPEQYDRLIAFVGKNAETKAGFLGERVVNLKNIDAVEMDLLKGMVDRAVRTRIQSMPTRGDFADGLFSFWGRIAFQFRTFNIKGIDNFLIQNTTRIARGGTQGQIKVATEIGATMLFAGTIQYLRNYADWESYNSAGDTAKADQIAQNMGVVGFARGALTGPSEFFPLILGADAVWTRAIDPDPLFSPYRYSSLGSFEFPAIASVRRAQGVIGDVYGATVGKGLGLGAERDITQGTIHKMRLLTPWQSAPVIKQLFNIAENEVVDYWNLPKTQPRNRD